MDEDSLYFKAVRLISAEAAQALTITAEGPVFVPGQVYQRTTCPQCRRSYGPLVYHTGHVTQGEHWHEAGGGIYFCSPMPHVTLSLLASLYGFAAILEPLAEVAPVQEDPILQLHSRAVLVKEIVPCCQAFPQHSGSYTLLSEGFIGANKTGRGNLMPFCNEHGRTTAPPYRFRVEQGAVYFSLLAP